MARPAAQRPSPSCCSQGGGSFGAALAQGQPPGELTLELVAQAGIGDGGPALEAPIGDVRGIAVDPAGNLFLAISDQQRVRKVTPDGLIATVAGAGASGAGEFARSQIEFPVAVAVSPDGTIYVADENAHRVWRIDHRGVQPCAGTGRYRSADHDDGQEEDPLEVDLGRPSGVAVDGSGRIYIADRALDRIFVVDLDGKLRNLCGRHGEGAPEPTPIASLDGPEHVAVSPAGKAYFVDSRGQRLGTIDSDGRIQEIRPPTEGSIRGIAVSASGDLHAMAGGAVWRRSGGEWSVVSRSEPRQAPQDGFGSGGPIALRADAAVFVADRLGHRVFRIDPHGSPVAVAGNGTRARHGDGGSAGSASFSCADISAGAGGAFYISDTVNHRVARVGPGGAIETVAGRGEPGTDGDGQDARLAALSAPAGLSLGADGSLFIADPAEGRIRRVSPEGIISTVAGTGTHGFNGDGGFAVLADLNHPGAVAVSDDGTLFISDSANFRVRRVDLLGKITTIAGNGANADPEDGALAEQSPLGAPQGIAVRQDGTIVVAIPSRYAVREIGTDGRVRTLVHDVPAGVMRPWTPLDVAVTPGADYVTAYGVPWLVRLAPGAGGLRVADAPRLDAPVSGMAFRSVATRSDELLLCEEFARRIWRAPIAGQP